MNGRLLLPAVLAIVFAGCGTSGVPNRVSTPVLMVSTADEPVLLSSSPGAVETLDRPEIGRLEMYRGDLKALCSGTLIQPDIVLTAAHCVNYREDGDADPRDVFSVQTDTQPAGHSYRIRRYHSFGSKVGPDDIAVVQLLESVDASLATPTSLAHTVPEEGSGVHVYGYGCTSRNRTDSVTHSTGVKRKWLFDWHSDRVERLCYGDSGGPVVLGATGAVFAVNSGHEGEHGGRGADIYALIGPMRGTILSQIDDWRDSEKPPERRRGRWTLFAGVRGGSTGLGYFGGAIAAEYRSGVLLGLDVEAFSFSQAYVNTERRLEDGKTVSSSKYQNNAGISFDAKFGVTPLRQEAKKGSAGIELSILVKGGGVLIPGSYTPTFDITDYCTQSVSQPRPDCMAGPRKVPGPSESYVTVGVRSGIETELLLRMSRKSSVILSLGGEMLVPASRQVLPNPSFGVTGALGGGFDL